MSAAEADIVSSAGRDVNRASTPTSEIGMPLMIPGAFDARVPRGFLAGNRQQHFAGESCFE